MRSESSAKPEPQGAPGRGLPYVGSGTLARSLLPPLAHNPDLIRHHGPSPLEHPRQVVAERHFVLGKESPLRGAVTDR